MKHFNKTIMRSTTALLTFITGVTPIVANTQGDGKQPNIVLIFSDDVGFEEYGLYGVQGGESKTPNIDALAREGIGFKTAWAQSISGPSRSMLYTGCYASTTGSYDNKIQWCPNSNNKKDKTLPAMTRVIHDAGYRVGMAGKWHFAVGEVLGMDEGRLGIDDYLLWNSEPITTEKICGVKPEYNDFSECEATTGKPMLSRYWQPSLIRNGVLQESTRNDYGPDKLSDFICEFIEESAKGDKPFFALYPQVLAHSSHCVTPYEVAEGAEPSNKHYRSGSELGLEYFHSQIRYADMLVGKIIDKLKEVGEYENTIIIYTSDNGTTSSAKTKGVEYGVHIPMVMGGGVVKQRGLTDELIDFTDILPTLADFAQTQIPTRCDGVSAKDFITGKKDETKPVIYAQPGVTSLVRTKDFLLEAVSPIYGKPEGRFYKTNGSFDGRGYENITHDENYKEERAKFDEYLKNHSSKLPLFDDPEWDKNPLIKGKKLWQSEERVRSHHRLPLKYNFYDASF